MIEILETFDKIKYLKLNKPLPPTTIQKSFVKMPNIKLKDMILSIHLINYE